MTKNDTLYTKQLPPKAWYSIEVATQSVVRLQPACKQQIKLLWLKHVATQSVVRLMQPACKLATQCGMFATCCVVQPAVWHYGCHMAPPKAWYDMKYKKYIDTLTTAPA